jgi:hypothetical protein
MNVRVVAQHVRVLRECLRVVGAGRTTVTGWNDVVQVAYRAAGQPAGLIAKDREVTQRPGEQAGLGFHRDQPPIHRVTEQPPHQQPPRSVPIHPDAASAGATRGATRGARVGGEAVVAGGVGDLAGDLGRDRAVAA